MKLSIIIICWNDWKVLKDCLRTIVDGTYKTDYEVIVSDNGSSDGSVEHIRANFPAVHIVENRANLGFSKGNNAGIREARGEYILILNPDTIIHDGSLDRWIEFADRYPEAGAFGCKVLNLDGTYQESARPFPTLWREMIAAFYARPLALLGSTFVSDLYYRWKGNTEREIDWQSGCCILFRGGLLKQLNGFDERFFYHFEEVDLCHRVWDAGYRIRYTPNASITHLGGQSVGRFPIRFALETSRNRYRYYHKYYGDSGTMRCRQVILIRLGIRRFFYCLLNIVRPTEALKNRLEMYRVAYQWNKHIDPIDFVKNGSEPSVEQITTIQPT